LALTTSAESPSSAEPCQFVICELRKLCSIIVELLQLGNRTFSISVNSSDLMKLAWIAVEVEVQPDAIAKSESSKKQYALACFNFFSFLRCWGWQIFEIMYFSKAEFVANIFCIEVDSGIVQQ
jgi:hypothetical protein